MSRNAGVSFVEGPGRPQAKPEEHDDRGDAHPGSISEPTADHYLNYTNTRTVFNFRGLSFASRALLLAAH